MRYLILDDETETYKFNNGTLNIFDPRGYIVMRGWKRDGYSKCMSVYFNSKDEVVPLTDEFLAGIDVIVGHNIKFDLLYEMQAGGRDALIRFFNRGGTIWDTQYAEYLISGQQDQMIPLNTLAPRYGGTEKVDGVKELWEAGYRTSEIDRDMLTDYLIGTEAEKRNGGDIGNTELIYLGQQNAVDKAGMRKAVELRMLGLLCTTEMEYNGLFANVETAREHLKDLNARLAETEAELAKYTAAIPEEVQFNWDSNIHKSVLFFGGTIKYEKVSTYIDEKTGELARYKATARWPLFDGEPVDPDEAFIRERDGRYFRLENISINGDDESADWIEQDTNKGGKNKGAPKFRNVPVQGELKTKICTFLFDFPGYTYPEKSWAGKLLDGRGNPVYSVDSDTVDILATRDVPFCNTFGEYSFLMKSIGTYYTRFHPKKKKWVGMLTFVGVNDHIVHHRLNHTSTVTTRLSSSDPNLQNIPRAGKSRVKEMFSSRFGDEGIMVEIDYSQLEVVIQGLLSLDKQLIADLNNRVDFHCKRVAAKQSLSGRQMTYEEALDWCKNESNPDYKAGKAERTACKEFSFQRAYGAGAEAINASTGIPLADVKLLIKAEDEMYPGVIKFNNRVKKECEHTAEPFRDPHRGWRVFRKGTWQAPTGTIYTFVSQDSPKFLKERGIDESFKPTELKNYPVQGTGGEVVQIALGQLFRWFMKMNNFGGDALLINTVHDCVWVDCKKTVVDQVVPAMVRIMEAIPMFLSMFFDIKCPVPFPVEAEVGPNMYSLHHYAEGACE